MGVDIVLVVTPVNIVYNNHIGSFVYPICLVMKGKRKLEKMVKCSTHAIGVIDTEDNGFEIIFEGEEEYLDEQEGLKFNCCPNCGKRLIEES